MYVDLYQLFVKTNMSHYISEDVNVFLALLFLHHSECLLETIESF